MSEEVFKTEYALTGAQKEAALNAWNKGATNVKKILHEVIGNYDLRSPQGVALKKYLSECVGVSGAQSGKTIEASLLTKQQKQFITDHIDQRPLTLARDIFKDESLLPTSVEARAVRTFYDTVDSPNKNSEFLNESRDIADTKYFGPRSIEAMCKKVSDCISEQIAYDRITPAQKEGVVRLVKYMNTHRFIYEMNLLELVSQRDMFENTFVKFCFDKPDLTEEEVEMYINYCANLICLLKMNKELKKLGDVRDAMMDADRNPPMSIIEAIGKLRGDISDLSKSQTKNLQDLNGKRVDRLKELSTVNESVLKLVDAFRDEKKRRLIASYLENRRATRMQEVARIENMDDLRMQVFGLGKEEVG